MRIIGGEFKGRRIEPPSAFKARPTTDYARESLLNILDNRYDFTAVSFLDLFAGTGAISYEFVSRGCRDIDVVETERRYCEFINGSFRNLGISSARVHRIDVRNWLKICHKQYDIIFADPPYILPWLTEIPDMVLSSAAVHKESLFILEHPKSLDFRKHIALSEHRKYGNVNFSFFRPVLQKLC